MMSPNAPPFIQTDLCDYQLMQQPAMPWCSQTPPMPEQYPRTCPVDPMLMYDVPDAYNCDGAAPSALPPAPGGGGGNGKKTKTRKSSKSSYKHVPHRDKPAHLVARRNARERRRVQAVNSAFARLRKCVPVETRGKRLSKVKTLQRAIEYIKGLQNLLTSDDDPTGLSSSYASPTSSSPLPAVDTLHNHHNQGQQPQHHHHHHQDGRRRQRHRQMLQRNDVTAQDDEDVDDDYFIGEDDDDEDEDELDEEDGSVSEVFRDLDGSYLSPAEEANFNKENESTQPWMAMTARFMPFHI